MGNPKSIDRIDRGIFHRGKRPAKCHIPTRSIRERYLSWRSVTVPWRSMTHCSTDRKKALQTGALIRVQSMRLVFPIAYDADYCRSGS
jgi:hypothetical protein